LWSIWQLQSCEEPVNYILKQNSSAGNSTCDPRYYKSAKNQFLYSDKTQSPGSNTLRIQ
jgi:hypothetical protein